MDSAWLPEVMILTELFFSVDHPLRRPKSENEKRKKNGESQNCSDSLIISDWDLRRRRAIEGSE
jgi:hypothetical protein